MRSHLNAIRICILICCGLCGPLPRPVQAQPQSLPELHLEPARVVVGETVSISLCWGPGEGEPVAEQRWLLQYEQAPGSQLARSTVLGRLGPGEALPWTPQRTGLVRLSLLSEESGEQLLQHDLGVRSRGRPASAIFMLGLVAFLLLGGLCLGVRTHWQPERS